MHRFYFLWVLYRPSFGLALSNEEVSKYFIAAWLTCTDMTFPVNLKYIVFTVIKGSITHPLYLNQYF